MRKDGRNLVFTARLTRSTFKSSKLQKAAKFVLAWHNKSLRPEVRLSIVQAVTVDVLAEHAGGNIGEKTVHLEIFSLFLFSVRQRVYGVPGSTCWNHLGIEMRL